MLIKVTVPYRQVFQMPPPKRKLWSGWFAKAVDVEIQIVDPRDAPIAYEVRLGPDETSRESSYQIRSYENRLWWPLDGERPQGLRAAEFANILDEGHPESLALLDPSFANYLEDDRGWPWRPIRQEFRPVEHDWNNLPNATAQAQRGASTTMICCDRVFVQAGEPIFYAVPYDHYAGKGLAIRPGVSDPRRECSGNFHAEPGPSRSHREESALRGFAFGIGEIDEAIPALQARGYAIKRLGDVDVLLDRHGAQTAPLICARELARHLFVESEAKPRGLRLREAIPVVGSAKTKDEVDDRCVDALWQLCSSRDPVVAFGFRGEIRTAKQILGRLGINPDEALAPEDDEALAALGPG
jgi:hypothetical protein